jgi:hypothetical protein
MLLTGVDRIPHLNEFEYLHDNSPPVRRIGGVPEQSNGGVVSVSSLKKSAGFIFIYLIFKFQFIVSVTFPLSPVTSFIFPTSVFCHPSSVFLLPSHILFPFST